MNKTETIKLFTVISAMFPRDTKFAQADQLMIDMWQKMLADISYEDAEKAVAASVSTSPFPPSIAEIRDYATRLNGTRRLTAEEAWGIASDLIRTCGTRTVLKEGATEKPPAMSGAEFGGRAYRCVAYQPSCREYEAKRRCPDPEVWAILQRMGWKDICESDAPDVVRGQFMRAWNSHDTEAKEVRVMSGVVPELVAAITTTILAQLGAGDE